MSLNNTHPLLLPPILKLALLHSPSMAHTKHTFPDTLARDTRDLGPPPATLVLENSNALVHLGLAQLGAVARRAGHNVSVAERVPRRHGLVLVRMTSDRRDPGRVEQLPEEV